MYVWDKTSEALMQSWGLTSLTYGYGQSNNGRQTANFMSVLN